MAPSRPEGLGGIEDRASAVLSAGARAYVGAGAGREDAVVENLRAWRRLGLRPRVLRGVAAGDTSTTLLGVPTRTPIMVAPTGRHRLLHPEGELATARGAAAAGSPYVVSTFATVPLEAIAVAVGGESLLWFQLALDQNGDEAPELCRRARAAGCRAIVVTVDQPVAGVSPRALRHPVEIPGGVTHANLRGAPRARVAWNGGAPGPVRPVDADDLARLVEAAGLPVVVKGILRPDDACRCLAAGAAGVIVSNHGGRHLEGALATADALAEVVAAAGEAEVYVDGGVRSGEDVLRALALGARAVLVGRPPLWGLAADGAGGVHDVLETLRIELARAMILCGTASVADVGPDLVRSRS